MLRIFYFYQGSFTLQTSENFIKKIQCNNEIKRVVCDNSKKPAAAQLFKVRFRDRPPQIM
jgi:hypothetical protein